MNINLLQYFKRAKEELKSIKIPKSAQESIPVEEIDYSGIIKVKNRLYSLVCEVGNINYTLARDKEQESVFKRYCDFLNSLNNDVKLQICISNTNVDDEKVLENILISENGEFLEYRQEYNDFLKEKVYQSKKSTATKNIYFILYCKAKDLEEAEEILFGCLDTAKVEITKMDTRLKNLSMVDTLCVLYNIYNKTEKNISPFDFKNSYHLQNLGFKDIIAPSSMRFNINHMLMSENLCRTIYVRELPEKLMDTVVSDVLNNHFFLLYSMHIEPVDQGKAVTFVNKKLTAMETTKRGYTKKSKSLMPYVPPMLQKMIENTDKTLNDLSSGDKRLFNVSIYVTIFASDIDELKTNTNKIRSIFDKHRISTAIMSHRQ